MIGSLKSSTHQGVAHMKVPNFSVHETGIADLAEKELSGNGPLTTPVRLYLKESLASHITSQNQFAHRIASALDPLRRLGEGGQQFPQLEHMLAAEVQTAKVALEKTTLTEHQVREVEGTAHTLYQCATGA